MTSPAARARILALVALLSILPFWPALKADFAFDDAELIVRHPAVSAAGPTLAWRLPYWPDRPSAGLYRPWTTMSFWLDAKLFGLNPRAFHAVNLALHAATSCLVFLLLLELFPAYAGRAAATALLFAVHPLHAEAVVGTVGRAELWAALAALLAYLTAHRHVRRPAAWLLGASGLSFLVAMLAKESSLGLLGLIALHQSRVPLDDPRSTAQRWTAVGAVWTGAAATALLLRLKVLGSLFALERVSLMDNPLAYVDPLRRALAALGLQAWTWFKVVVPISLSADYSFPALQATPLWMALGAVALIAMLGAALLAWRSRRKDLLFGLAFAASTALLTSNVLLPIGTVLGDRLSYLPSLGLLWLAASCAAPLLARRRGLGILLLAAALLGYGARSFARSGDWQNDLTLFAAATRDAPRSAKAWSNYATSLLHADREPEALAAAERSLALAPDYPPSLSAKGMALLRLGRARESLEPLRRASLPRPGSSPRIESILELGNAYLSLAQGASAESVFTQAGRIAGPADGRVWIGRASAFALQRRWPESSRAWRRAALLTPGDPAVRRQWAYALAQAGEPDSALAEYESLRRSHPRDAEVTNDLAWFLAANDRDPSRAVALARDAFQRAPTADHGDTVLEAYFRAGRADEAEAWVDSLAAASNPLAPGLRSGYVSRRGSGTPR